MLRPLLLVGFFLVFTMIGLGCGQGEDVGRKNTAQVAAIKPAPEAEAAKKAEPSAPVTKPLPSPSAPPVPLDVPMPEPMPGTPLPEGGGVGGFAGAGFAGGGVGGFAGGGFGGGFAGMMGMGGMPPGMGMGGMGGMAGTGSAVPRGVGGLLPGGPRDAAVLLTAGSFDDNRDPAPFLAFARKIGTALPLAAKMKGRRVTMLVKDANGNPVGNARVKLQAKGAATELITRTDGRAIFVLPWDRLPANEELTATVTPPFGARPVTQTVAVKQNLCEIRLTDAQAQLPRCLDLAFLVDTTGSMGDELEYLKTEIRGIVTALGKKYPEVQQRYGLVLYRDEGDEYVTRRFDFTRSLDDFKANLDKQAADAGGDHPEAVHRGLEECNDLTWQENDTARVLFWLADAPPHPEFVDRSMNAANALRRKGIVFYPVACSGYDDTTEFVMRSCGLMTGGQLLFLTDDSGIGNPHAEPRIPRYKVEHLNKLILRMVVSELAGERIEAADADVIRSVGMKGSTKKAGAAK